MDVWNYLLKDTLLQVWLFHTKKGWHHEFPGEGDTYGGLRAAEGQEDTSVVV